MLDVHKVSAKSVSWSSRIAQILQIHLTKAVTHEIRRTNLKKKMPTLETLWTPVTSDQHLCSFTFLHTTGSTI